MIFIGLVCLDAAVAQIYSDFRKGAFMYSELKNHDGSFVLSVGGAYNSKMGFSIEKSNLPSKH